MLPKPEIITKADITGTKTFNCEFISNKYNYKPNFELSREITTF